MGADQAADATRQQARRAEWAEQAAGYRAYMNEIAEHWRASGEMLLDALCAAPGMHALDLACGFGEPALAIAEAVAPDGRVIATDLVPEMLALAAERAEARGARNIWFQQADAERLPFPDASFDRVSCRFGVMYFPDVARALGEMRRVLRPGGRVALAVWGPAEGNTLVRSLAVVDEYVPTPPPEPDTPHMFRFAAVGTLGAALRDAGFRRVEEVQRTLAQPWPLPAEQAWRAVLDTSPPLRHAVEDLTVERRAAVRDAVLANFRALSDGRRLNFFAPVIVAAGMREAWEESTSVRMSPT